MFKELLLVLVGGLCAAFGGFLATWYLAKNSRRIKREEVIGEKQVEVYQKAASIASNLQYRLLQGQKFQDIYKFVGANHNWFWENRPLLPKDYQNGWCTIKAHLMTAMQMDESVRGGTSLRKMEEDFLQLRNKLQNLVKQMEKEVLAELGCTPIEILDLENRDCV